MRNVFVGPNGLRSGWRALIFVALVAGMAVLAGRLIGPYLRAQTALGAATGPRFTIVAELATFCLPVILATWIMGRIEKRSGWSYGLIDGQGIGHFVWGAFWGLISLSGLVGVLVLTGHLLKDPEFTLKFHRGDLFRGTRLESQAGILVAHERPPIVLEASADAVVQTLEQAETQAEEP